MKVRMNVTIAGTRTVTGKNGEAETYRWPSIGGVLDLPEQEAIDLIRQGNASKATAEDEKAWAAVEAAQKAEQEAAEVFADAAIEAQAKADAAQVELAEKQAAAQVVLDEAKDKAATVRAKGIGYVGTKSGLVKSEK